MIFTSVQQLLATQADHTPEAIAIAAPGRLPLTYGQLWSHVQQLGLQFKALGLRRNDPVAIVLPNGPEMAVAFLTVAAVAASAPLNPAYRAGEFEFYLSDLKARALLTLAGLDSPAVRVAQAQHIPVIELTPLPDHAAGLFRLSDVPHLPGPFSSWAEPDDIALILHTSGTTSHPKIVPLTQRNLLASAANIGRTLHLTPQDRCLNIMPLFHIHGLMAALLASLAAGASVVCTPGFSVPGFFDWLVPQQPTWYTAVPTMHQAILNHAQAHQDVLAQTRLRFIRSSSASLPPPVMADLESIFNAPVIEAYGMTEATHQMASNPLPPDRRKPGSVGQAAGPEVAIMDEAGSLLPTGERGEIVIRGANVTAGYQNNPAANAKAFTQGWFRTGDEGYFDHEGYLFITGRLKEMINRGGEKVAPREVDEVLMAHPAVAQAVTFAVPHPTLSEDVAAAVIPKEGTVLTEQALRQFAFTHLADFKVPSQILIVDYIPQGATGKLQRIGLADKLSAQLKPAFVPPRTPIEVTLANLWAEVLGLEQVGLNDNFFALGGDSLRATQLVSQVRSIFQVELALRAVFQEPTLAGQAALVKQIKTDHLQTQSALIKAAARQTYRLKRT